MPYSTSSSGSAPASTVPPELLVSVAAVFARVSNRGSVPDIISTVGSFIALHPSWSLELAAHAGSARLLRILLNRPPFVGTDRRYVAYILNRGLDRAATVGTLRTFENFMLYFPEVVITHAAVIAARNGHTCIVSWLLHHGRVVWGPGVLVAAASHGTVAGLKRLLDGLYVPPDPSLLVLAVESNHVWLSQWLWCHFAAAGSLTALSSAIEVADVRMSAWMLANAPRCFRFVPINIDPAASRGDIAWLRWAQEGCTTATTLAMDAAASNGHLDTVEWLHDNRSEGCTSDAMDGAAKGGHLSILMWLRGARSQTWTPRAILLAAIHGHLDVLRWLLDMGGVKAPPATFDEAAAHGQLEIVRWMTVTGRGAATHRAMDLAATNGHFHVVQFLNDNRAEGCTTAAFDGAAANGHLRIVQFLDQFRTEGFTTYAFDTAAKNGHREVLEYIQAFYDDVWTPLALVGAARGGHTWLVRWLVELFDMPVTTDVENAALESGNIALVQYLNGDILRLGTQDGIDAAVAAGHFHLLSYRQSHMQISCSPRAVKNAIENDELYLAAWAYKNCSETPRLDTSAEVFWRRGWHGDIVRSAFR